MKIEDSGVTAEFVPGRYPNGPDCVRFSEGGVAVEVPLHVLSLAQYAWA